MPPLKYNSPNFRSFTRVYMVEVYEGKGTTDDPGRIVRYFFDEKSQEVGVFDPLNDPSFYGDRGLPTQK